jgi:protein O-mannosyl-transferase
MRSVLVCTLLLIVVFGTFGRALQQDFAPIDDTLLVRENLAIRGFTLENLRYVFTHYDPEIYIPLTFVTFQLNYVLGGLDPFGYHFFNILLHGLNAILVCVLLLRLLEVLEPRTEKQGARYAFAFGGALLFAVHPLHTEAVVWVAGRKDLLSTFFYLATLLAYLKAGSLQNSWCWYTGSVFLALCAMLSKAMAITLPATLLLLDWFVKDMSHGERSRTMTHDTRWRLLLINKIPFLTFALIFAVIAMGGKERVVGSTSLVDISLVALRSSVHYLQQMILPMGLNVFYQLRSPITLLEPRIFVSFGVILALVALCWRFRKRAPWLAFGILFFFVTLSPTFFNFNKGLIAFYAVDRYAYLPSVGILFVIVAGVRSLFSRHAVFVTRYALWGVMIVSAVFLVLSMRQVRTWDSAVTLYEHAVAADLASVPARSTLAQALRQLGRPLEGFEVLREGLQYGDDVSYHLEAGNIYAANGQVNDAIQEFTKASQMKPDLPESYFSIGNLEEHRGSTDLALEYYHKALSLDPSYVGARVRIADVLIDRGELGDAEEQLIAALEWNPSSYGANLQMYRLRLAQGKEGEAEEYLMRVKALRPYVAIDGK